MLPSNLSNSSRSGHKQQIIPLFLFLRLLQRNPELLENDEVVMKVISSLMKSEQYQQAGELYELVQKPNKALECYRKGHVYIKAVELAKFVAPKGQ